MTYEESKDAQRRQRNLEFVEEYRKKIAHKNRYAYQPEIPHESFDHDQIEGLDAKKLLERIENE